MCFSMAASMTAGGVLTVAGAAALRETTSKREMPLAAMPLFFGVQQIAEGFAWHALTYGSGSTGGIHTFLFFAYFFWPIYIPLMVRSLEDDPLRRKILTAFALLGAGVGLYLLGYLVRGEVLFRIVENSLAYDIRDVPFPWVILLYCVPVCIAPLISSVRFVRGLGVAVIISLLVSVWFYRETFTSVWCFFAALLSGAIWWYLKSKKRLRT